MQAHGQSATPQLSSAIQPPEVPDHEMLQLIGRGAYGEVWLARNTIGTLRAVKIVHCQTFDRAEHFEREFKGLLRFEPLSRSHEGLVDILQIGRRDDAGYFYYVMELADSAVKRSEGAPEIWSTGRTPSGHHSTAPSLQDSASYTARTLRSELRAGPLPPAACVTLGLKLASALEHLHAHGLVHRDIKPSNIIFVNGEPKLADIGLVTTIGEAHSLVGTVGYIPPEGPGTPQADLYSLGKVLYEIALGKDCQDFPHLPSNLESHPDYSALLEFNEVILKACETNPRHRYQVASALGADLAVLQSGYSLKRKHALAQWLSVTKRITVAAIVLVLLIGTALTFKPRNRQRSTTSEAIQLYEKGRFQYSRLTDDSLKKAVEYLNQATQLDPGFAPAYVTLFEIYCWNPGGISDTEKFSRVREIATKLMAIDPKMGEAHAALSWARFGDGDWPAAEREMRRAVQLKPDYATAHGILGFYLALKGAVEEAHQELQRALQLDPTSRIEATVAGYPSLAERKYDEAIAQFRRALELDPNFPIAYSWIGKAFEAKGDYSAAIEAFEKSELLEGGDEAKVKQASQELRHAFQASGARGYWLKALELQQAAEVHGPNKPQTGRWFLSGIYAQLGERDKALELLEGGGEPGGPQIWLKVEPAYFVLQKEPRFNALLKKVGLEQ